MVDVTLMRMRLSKAGFQRERTHVRPAPADMNCRSRDAGDISEMRFGALSPPGLFAVQQPAAEYANQRCDDEKIEQREIFKNRRHGLFPPLQIIT
ncbi:hypothetical protein [Rhizobium leguminosarum]